MRHSEFDGAREAIVVWARAHAPRLDLLSPGRCIVVADSGDGAWRLWQIVRAAPSLRRWLLDQAYSEAGALLDALGLAARTLFEASLHAKSAGLPITFDSIGRGEHGAQFVSLMPGPASRFEPVLSPDPKAALSNLHGQLTALLNSELWDRLQDLRSALQNGSANSTADEWRLRVAEAIEVVAES